jgi:ribosomal protein S18 acetylase RimI-like enzyme
LVTTSHLSNLLGTERRFIRDDEARLRQEHGHRGTAREPGSESDGRSTGDSVTGFIDVASEDNTMELREPTSDDTERMRELAQSAMTTSYALSPRQIETIAEEQFGDERLTRTFDDSDAVALVAESEEWDTVVGFVVGERDGSEGEVQWLMVDPEHRGARVGTRLFETAVESLRERGAERVSATTLESNTEGDDFFERFGFERTDDRRVEIGDESLVEYVYVEPEEADGTPTESAEDAELPNAETRDGVTTATTNDGEEVYVDRDEEESGTEGPFYAAYTDEECTEKFGYYCSNCGSLDTTMDNVERIECAECGNTHVSRSTEEYDDSYL